LAGAWDTFRGGEVPRLIEPAMTTMLGTLTDAVEAQDQAETQRAAIQVARLGYDLQLRYRPVVEVDLERLDLWAVELMVDAEANDTAAVGADHFALDYIRDRVVHALSTADRTAVNEAVNAIQVAVVDQDINAAVEAAGQLREALTTIEPTS
jgi:hypothetical protein